MKQSGSNQSNKQKMAPKLMRPTPYPRNYENMTVECLRNVQLVDYEMTPRMNHAQVVTHNQEVFYENHINLESLTALKQFTHDAQPAEEQVQAKSAPKTVYEVKHGVSIRKKQPSMGVKAATLKTSKFTASAEAKRELALASSSSECSIIYDSEIDMLIRQRSEAKRQELAGTHQTLKQESKQLSANTWHSEVNLNRISGISAATFDIIESIKKAKQEPTCLIPQSQSQQNIQAKPDSISQNLVPFLENTSFKKSHTSVIAHKAPFSPVRASKQSSDSSSDMNNHSDGSKNTVSTASTFSLIQQKMSSLDAEPIYENDWSMKQKQLQLNSKYLTTSSSSLQQDKFLPKSTSSTTSTSSLRSMDSTTSLSGSSCCSMNSDMDTIVSSASMNAMSALDTLPAASAASSYHRRLFLDNTSSNMNFVEDTTMV